MKVLITAPSLDPTQNVSGVSSVVNFIMNNNRTAEYIHFELGKKDKEKGGWRRVSQLYASYKRWNETLKNYPEALIHYNFPLSTLSILRDFFFMRKAYKKGRKMVVHIHGGNYMTAPKTPLILRKLLQKVFSWDLPFIVLSNNEKRLLEEKYGPRRIEVLPNCVDLEEALKYNKSPKDDDEPLILGYLGRIEPNKGMNELLKACERLKNEGVDFKLRIAGKEAHEDEFLPLFDSCLGSCFHYDGIVSGEKKNDFLRSLDVFVLPSYFEGLPISLLESMSFGAVPVVTPVGSMPDVVENGKNGYFVEVRDVDSIVNVIQRIYQQRELAFSVGEKAKETIYKQFSPTEYVNKLNNLYNTL